MDPARLSTITQDIIAFLVDASNQRQAFADELISAAASDPTGHTIRANFTFAMILNDEQIPIFHRLIVGKALLMHVDWEEVAAFFSSNDTTETREV